MKFFYVNRKEEFILDKCKDFYKKNHKYNIRSLIYI